MDNIIIEKTESEINHSHNERISRVLRPLIKKARISKSNYKKHVPELTFAETIFALTDLSKMGNVESKMVQKGNFVEREYKLNDRGFQWISDVMEYYIDKLPYDVRRIKI